MLKTAKKKTVSILQFIVIQWSSVWLQVYTLRNILGKKKRKKTRD